MYVLKSKVHIALAFGLFLYIVGLFYVAATTPLSPHEAEVIYTHVLLGSLLRWIHGYFDGFFSVRIPSLVAGLIASVLFWKVSIFYLKNKKDRLLALALFLLQPAMVTAFVLANSAVWMVVALWLTLWAYHHRNWIVLFLALSLAYIVDDSAIILYIALFAFALFEKEPLLIWISVPFWVVTILQKHWIDVSGKPAGHFLDMVGMYATLFTPLLFVYIFYTLYRIWLREAKTLLWYIAFSGFVVSLLLALRQKVYITDYAPFVSGAVMLSVWMYGKSYRVRLPIYRKWYRRALWLVVAFMVVSFIVIVTHRWSYKLSGNHPNHFAHRLYEHQYNALKLLQSHKCYKVKHRQYRLLYHFYGVKICP